MSEYVKNAMENINRLMADASDRALYLVKREARRILREDPDLNEFVMAMGSCYFSYKKGGKYDPLSYTEEQLIQMEDNEWNFYGAEDGILHNDLSNAVRFQPEFFDMIDDLDADFRISGYPVRFTAEGEELSDW